MLVLLHLLVGIQAHAAHSGSPISSHFQLRCSWNFTSPPGAGRKMMVRKLSYSGSIISGTDCALQKAGSRCLGAHLILQGVKDKETSIEYRPWEGCGLEAHKAHKAGANCVPWQEQTLCLCCGCQPAALPLLFPFQRLPITSGYPRELGAAHPALGNNFPWVDSQQSPEQSSAA